MHVYVTPDGRVLMEGWYIGSLVPGGNGTWTPDSSLMESIRQAMEPLETRKYWSAATMSEWLDRFNEIF